MFSAVVDKGSRIAGRPRKVLANLEADSYAAAHGTRGLYKVDRLAILAHHRT